MTDRFRLRILDRIRTGRISRMADRFRLRIRDMIHTGRFHRTAGRFRLSIQDRIHTGRIKQNSGQFPPQNGQPPYWQNQYNNGQPPYWQNQPQRPRREKNSFATISLISGIFALLTLCCFAFPVAIICGVGAVCFAIISKKGQPFRGTAVAGIILGVIAVLLGIGEFFYVLTITNLMKDPANAAAFNEFFEQFQRQLGIN